MKPEDVKLRSPRELIDEAKARQGEQAERIAAYDRQIAAYMDQQDSSSTRIRGSNADGRPVLRAEQMRSDLRRFRRGAPNYVIPVVDSTVAVRGVLPEVRVNAAGPEPEELEKATRRTRILRWQYEISQLELQQPRGAFYLSAMGDMLYILEPMTPDKAKEIADPFQPPGIHVTIINPSFAFPRFGTGRNALELEDLFLVWDIDPASAKGYGVVTDKPVTLYQYWSRDQLQVIVGDGATSAAHVIRHGLGYVPAQWVPNKPTDGRFATADIASAIWTNEEIQSMYYMFADALAWAVYPLVEVRNPQRVRGERIQVGPGAKVETQGDGAVILHAPAANPGAAQGIMAEVVQNLMMMTGTSRSRVSGEVERSNTSAKAIDRSQQPVEARVLIQNVLLGSQLKRMNSKILLMLHTIPEFKNTPMVMHGIERGEPFRDTFTGAELEGWHHNSVKWHPMMGMGMHERVNIAMALFKEDLLPARVVLEEYGAENAEALLLEAEAEKKRRLQMEMELQRQMQGGPPPSGGGAPPMPGVEAGEQGGAAAPAAPDGQAVQPPPAPPAMPGFPPQPSAPNARGYGHAVAVPDVMAALQQALGQVSWSGTPGELRIGNGVVYVVGVEVRDREKVKAALAPVLAQLMPGVSLKIVPSEEAVR